jgi:hypothetical protein
MTRRIVPNEQLFQGWVPPDNCMDLEKRKKYVFPELWQGDISAEDWRNNDKLTEDQRQRRDWNNWLNTILYVSIFAFFKDEFSRGITKDNVVDFHAYQLNGFDWDVLEREGFTNQDRLVAEAMISRVAFSFPMGYGS